jgi:hypothetical protein
MEYEFHQKGTFMQHPPALYNDLSLAGRFRHLPRGKQLLLIVLAILGILLLVTATLYAILPSNTPLVKATQTTTPTPTMVLATPTPSIAGQFVLSSAPHSQEVLVLRQYGDAITGTATTTTCVAGTLHSTQAIVTGQMFANGQVRLTFSSPTQAHSSTVLYTVVPSTTGFTLNWNDRLGHPQTQQWAQLGTTITPPFQC